MISVKVWCEYDFNGQFGGNNNEEVCLVEDSLLDIEIEEKLLQYLVKQAGVPEEELKGFWAWEHINLKVVR